METPRVFTNFENQIGKYSNAYDKSDRDWKIINKLKKNDMNTTFILQDEDNNIDIKFISPASRITQRYGYKVHDKVHNKQAGDIISKDEIITMSSAYDDELNFKYGVNLKAMYLSYKNLEFEDPFVISETAAKKLDNSTVDEIEITLNNNDILINLFGDENNYKSFPDIGEKLDNTIIASRRRKGRKEIIKK